MLREIDTNLWVIEQPLRFMGLEVGTRMTVIRLQDNSLVLISPLQLTSAIQVELDDLGEVKYLVAPNLFHYLYLAQAQAIYPQAIVCAPPGLASKQPELKIDKVLTQDRLEFESELEYFLLDGFQAFVFNKIATANEVVFYHPVSKTLIITDSAFNFDRSFPWLTQFATRLLGSDRVLKSSWLEKIAIQDKNLLQSSINKVLAWDFQRVIMAHGQIVEHKAKQQLAAGYQWLTE